MSFWNWLRRRRQREGELDEEVRTHLQKCGLNWDSIPRRC